MIRCVRAGALLCAVLIALAVPQLSLGQPASDPAQSSHPIKIVLVGDSTVALEGGWGPGFCAWVKPVAQCIDLAANGRSTKSFLDQGLWQKALDERGNFYFIQFGHNDQKPRPALHTDPDTTYAQNLRLYVRDVQAIGGTPILVTPLSRRNYKDGQLAVDPLQDYARAARGVATEMNVPLIDLYQLSTALLPTMTQEEADRFDAVAHPDASAEGSTQVTPDRTHLNDSGKQFFGTMMADEAKEKVPGLSRWMRAHAQPTH